jgi:Bacterial PH domain
MDVYRNVVSYVLGWIAVAVVSLAYVLAVTASDIMEQAGQNLALIASGLLIVSFSHQFLIRPRLVVDVNGLRVVNPLTTEQWIPWRNVREVDGARLLRIRRTDGTRVTVWAVHGMPRRGRG